MANNLIQFQKAAKEALYVLSNTLGYVGKVSTKYAKEYRMADRHGSQIIVPKPPRYLVNRGEVASIQNITEPSVVVTVQPLFNLSLAPSGDDLDLILGNKMSDWSDRVAQPAMSQVAASIDFELAEAIRLASPNYVGTPGVAPATLAAILAVGTRLNQEGMPNARRSMALGPTAHGSVLNALSGNFVQKVIEAAELRANLDFPIAGFSGGIRMTQSTPAHATGSRAGVSVIDGAGQSGASLNLRGLTALTQINRGDVLSIAGVNAVNYQTRVSTGVVRQFVATANAVANAAGEVTVPVYPSLNPPVGGLQQQFQTVDSFPADGAAVTFVGAASTTFQESVAFEENAVGFITVPQFLAPDAAYAEIVEYKGIAMRLWLDSDITNNRQIFRIDVRAAFPVYYPEGCVRIAS